MTETLLDAIESALLDAKRFNVNAEVAPVAVLWTDREKQFTSVVRMLSPRMTILTLGELQPERLQGPAYWLRCAIAGSIHVEGNDGQPVIYLPGVGRNDLRAVERCPRVLASIAELQYRGEWFSHPNGKDWTPRSFLSNRDKGLGLDVADGAVTSEALLHAFEGLLALPLRRLSGRLIDADFLHSLLNPDQIGALLEWLDDPTNFRGRVDEGRWNAFVEQCKSDYGFDPASEGELTGAGLLGERQGAWAEVWRRFEQQPDRYAGIEERLRNAKPDRLFSGADGAWPQDNEKKEDELRSALHATKGEPGEVVREQVRALWDSHRERRSWVWAKLDRSPLLFALEQLEALAGVCSRGPTDGLAALVEAYSQEGWRADDAFLAALGAVEEDADREAVRAAATALYRPWVEAHAKALQSTIGDPSRGAAYSAGPEASDQAGTITVFVDGLRLDLGHRLAHRLGGFRVSIDTTLAALPTITPTAKPAVTPVPPNALCGGDELSAARTSSGAKATASVLRSLMGERGLQVMRGGETGDPPGAAWTEVGEIDVRGHQFQAAFVGEIDTELDRIARRVALLVDAGWKQVDVVTDHGWILLPGGLEKVELPAAAVATKKGRCARLKDGASVSVPTVPWHWDKDVRIALAPGITCFEANQEYEHGGVSLQECVVPRIRVRASDTRVVTGGAAITKLKWLGLLCRVEFENVAPGATLDIRALPADASTSVAVEARETAGAGKASLFIEDEDLEGEPAFVVIIAKDGSIVTQRKVVIGVNQ